MTPIRELVGQSASFDVDKKDFTVVANDAWFTNGWLHWPYDADGVLEVEEHALDQIAMRLDIPPGYLKRCPGHVQDANLNYWLEDLTQKAQASHRLSPNLFVRTYEDRVRAFLTDSYSPVDNTAILETIDELLPEDNYKLVRPAVGRDDLYLRILVIDGVGPDKNYGFGAYVHNGETGRRGLMVAPFMQRTSCTNSTIWATEAFKVRHVVSSKHSAGWLMANVKEYLGRSFRLGDKMIENVVRAEAIKIPDLHNVIADLGRKYKMSREEERMTLLGTENAKTKLGVINGLTFMAKQLEDHDRTLLFEGLAGAILAEPGSLFDVAAKRAQRALAEL